jgi:hypothetical protein
MPAAKKPAAKKPAAKKAAPKKAIKKAAPKAKPAKKVKASAKKAAPKKAAGNKAMLYAPASGSDVDLKVHIRAACAILEGMNGTQAATVHGLLQKALKMV